MKVSVMYLTKYVFLLRYPNTMSQNLYKMFPGGEYSLNGLFCDKNYE